MLKTVADLLDKFLEYERKALDSQSITHPPTIGAMYEGLTKDALSRVLPISNVLSVTSGFARGADGKLSKQLDCMLVSGEGEAVPHTGFKVYEIHQIIAVVEVKKELYKNDLAEGLDNLQSVNDLKLSNAANVPAIFRVAFQGLTGCPFPDDPNALPPELRIYYHKLRVEAVKPVRILLGYHGYTSENGIRKGLGAHLETLYENGKFGLQAVPNLILNRHVAVIKGNGMPWAGRLVDGWWPLLLTSGSIPIANAFLEVIWSRLNYLNLVPPSVFGEDLEIEQFNKLLDVRYIPDKNGWECRLHPAAVDPSEIQTPSSWEPVILTDSQHILVMLLCNKGEIDLNNLMTGMPPKIDVQADLDSLKQRGLIGNNPAIPNVYRLLTKECLVAILPDGRGIAGENVSGRLMRWIDKFKEKWDSEMNKDDSQKNQQS